MAQFTNTDSVIDSRDIIERIEELQGIKDTLQEEFNSIPENSGVDFNYWVCNQVEFSREDYEELEILKELQEQCSHCDDWQYGEQLIHRDYFETYMDEMVEECYELPKDMPYWMSIKLDYDALEQDYTSVDFDGQEFLIRDV